MDFLLGFSVGLVASPILWALIKKGYEKLKGLIDKL